MQFFRIQQDIIREGSLLNISTALGLLAFLSWRNLKQNIL